MTSLFSVKMSRKAYLKIVNPNRFCKKYHNFVYKNKDYDMCTKCGMHRTHSD